MPKQAVNGKVVLVTGGTGSFGSHFIERLLKRFSPKKVIVFSRDELKQSQMASRIQDKRIRFLLGDVRDLQRLQRAFHGVDVVIHAAALKQVPTLEYNPFEAVQTNIIGGENVINAAIDNGVGKVVALSTDKAVNPVNLYGATKLCAEKLFVAGNSYAAGVKTRFSVMRYGNVLGSRGSVVPLFLERRRSGTLPITDERMTRFWITLSGGVDAVLWAVAHMRGGEIFVPKLPSMRVTDLARAVAPRCRIDVVGVRPGEKIHEVLLTEDESARAIDVGDYYVVKPLFPFWRDRDDWTGGRSLKREFCYSSGTNDRWLKPAEMAKLLRTLA